MQIFMHIYIMHGTRQYNVIKSNKHLESQNSNLFQHPHILTVLTWVIFAFSRLTVVERVTDPSMHKPRSYIEFPCDNTCRADSSIVLGWAFSPNSDSSPSKYRFRAPVATLNDSGRTHAPIVTCMQVGM